MMCFFFNKKKDRNKVYYELCFIMYHIGNVDLMIVGFSYTT